MKFIDKYPNCTGCPVYKYCGTMCMSIRLCNSYDSICNDTKEISIQE